jgi:4-amino-4-deoxy-L-arabinose transferase-like glycosyltransferase
MRKKNKDITTLLNLHKIDIAFGLLMVILFLQYNYYISLNEVPKWDGAAYLNNARSWLSGTPLFQDFRPPLISLLIAGIWVFTGENWQTIQFLQAAFTMGAGILLYVTIRKYKGSLFALGVSALTMLNAQVFIASTQIYTEGLSLFFLVATLYFLKTSKPSNWFLAGIMMGLTFASRYPIILQAVTIFIIETLIRKDWKLPLRTIAAVVPVFMIVIVVLFLKTGTFQVALAKDSNLTLFLSEFYLVNSIDIWGLAFLLVPVAFLFRRTYADKYNYTFIAWFVVALLFWSASTSNHQFRFAIQFTPAVYYLAILAIENIVKSNMTIEAIKGRFGGRASNSIEKRRIASGNLMDPDDVFQTSNAYLKFNENRQVT